MMMQAVYVAFMAAAMTVRAEPDAARIAAIKTSVETLESNRDSLFEDLASTDAVLRVAEDCLRRHNTKTLPESTNSLDAASRNVVKLSEMLKNLEERITATDETIGDATLLSELNSVAGADASTDASAVMTEAATLGSAISSLKSGVDSSLSSITTGLQSEAGSSAANLTTQSTDINTVSDALADQFCENGIFTVSAEGQSSVTFESAFSANPNVQLSVVGFRHHLLNPYGYDSEEHPVFGAYVDVLGFDFTISSTTTSGFVVDVDIEDDSSVVLKNIFLQYTACSDISVVP